MYERVGIACFLHTMGGDNVQIEGGSRGSPLYLDPASACRRASSFPGMEYIIWYIEGQIREE